MDIKYGKLSKVCANCGTAFSMKAWIDGKRVSLQYRKYCIECSPYGKKHKRQHTFKWKTVNGIEHKQCSKCKEFLPATHEYFSLDKQRVDTGRAKGLKSECKTCAVQRLRDYKLRAVEYKGGQCEDCKGKFPACAYDFHHLDPSQKDFMIGRGGKDWGPVKTELDKCVLLCANCHRIRHASL